MVATTETGDWQEDLRQRVQKIKEKKMEGTQTMEAPAEEQAGPVPVEDAAEQLEEASVSDSSENLDLEGQEEESVPDGDDAALVGKEADTQVEADLLAAFREHWPDHVAAAHRTGKKASLTLKVSVANEDGTEVLAKPKLPQKPKKRGGTTRLEQGEPPQLVLYE